MSLCEFFPDLKMVRQENVQLTNRATAARRGQETLSCRSREGVSGGGRRKKRCKARKQVDCMRSGEVQVVTRDLGDFCIVGLEKAWAEREAPVGVNELSNEATAESWRR